MKFFDKQFVHVVWDDNLLQKQCFCSDNMGELIRYVEENKTVLKGIVTKSDNDDDFPFVLPNHEIGYRFAYYDPNYELKRAYSNGQTIQCMDSNGCWGDCCIPNWNINAKYRVKPIKCYVGIGRLKTLTWDFDPATYKYVYASFDAGRDASKWIDEHKKFVPIMRAFEKGLTIEYKRKGHRSDDWRIASTPSWDLQLRYRVKPQYNKPQYNYEHKKRRMTNRELAKWLADGNGQKIEGKNKFVYTTYAYKDGDSTPCRKGVLIRGWNETEWHEPEV